MSMRASLIITAKDEASAPFRRIAASARKLSDDARAMAVSGNAAGAGLDKMRGSATSLAVRLKLATVAAGQLAGRTGMMALEKAAYGVGFAIGTSLRSLASFALQATQVGAAMAVAAAAFVVTDIIRTGMQFETFEATLRNLTGSSAAAKQSLAWIQDFSTTTPFELDEVTQGFIRAKQRGIDPMDGSLRKLGDAASAVNRPIEDAVEAVSDGMRGQFERLIDFGVTASKSGDQVKLSWVKNGKEMSRTVSSDMLPMKAALLDIFDTLYGGTADAKSGTLSGILSNLRDQWGKFAKMIADAGIYDKVKQTFSDLLKWTNDLANNGQLQTWAQQISNQLGVMFDRGVAFVKGVDWGAVATGIGAIVEVLISAVEWFGKLAGAWQRMNLQAEISQQKTIANGWFTSAKEKADARWRIVEAQGRLDAMDYRPADMPAPSLGGPGPIRPGAARPVPAPVNGNRRGAPAARPIDGNVKVDVNVKASGGAQVQSTRVSSNDHRVQPTVRTGRAMAGAA